MTIPTLSQLYTGILADLQAQFGISISLFGKVYLRAQAAAQAARLYLIYLSIAKLQKNIFVDTADPEASGGTLERFGRVKLGRDPFPARAGQYTVEVTGQIGAVISLNTTFKSNDDSLSPGKLFVLDTAKTLTATTDTILLRALEAGVESKLEVGDELTVTAPIANVDSIATVTIETLEPAAAEDIEDYRDAAILAYQTETQGGAVGDYRVWASDAQGVERVYPEAKSGASNEINIYVEATSDDSIDGKGTPSDQLLEDVEEVIELDPDTTKPINERGRRPLGVFQIHYLPVSPQNVDIIINGFVGLTAPIQSAILSEITEQVNLIRPFLDGADILAEKNNILDINKIIAMILTANQVSIFTSVTLKIDSISVSTYTFQNGEIPYLNSVTYL